MVITYNYISIFYRLPLREHIVPILIIISLILCYCALTVETNDSRLININKHEFIRVLGNIMNSNEEVEAEDLRREFLLQDDEMTNIDDRDNIRNRINMVNTPRASMLRRNRKNNKNIYDRNVIKNEKRDSFFYLQKSLQKRDEVINNQQEPTVGRRARPTMNESL